MTADPPSCPIPCTVDPTTGEIIASIASEGDQSPRLDVPPFSTPSYSAAGMPARLLIAAGGEWARVTRPKFGSPDKRDWVRGSISTFSSRSRSRMLQSLAKTDRRSVSDDGLFVTLTYPREWPPSTAACKGHLEAFRKRVERMWPDAWFYWKLEYQQRGAEHFHLLIFNLPTVNPEWFHSTWYDIVKLGNHWHETYGADVRRMTSWKQAGSYCAKYCAKVEAGFDNPMPGRFWGIATRRNRVETIQEAAITDGEFFAIRRAFKRYMNLPGGYHAPGGSTSGVWTRISNGSAKRLLEWAAQEHPPPNGPSPPTDLELAGAYDGRAPYTGWSNRDGSAVARRTSTDHNGGKTNAALFDSADMQRRSARRLLT